MTDFVTRLIEKGHAYAADDGSVYFDISSFDDYGKLSGLDVDAVLSGARVSRWTSTKRRMRGTSCSGRPRVDRMPRWVPPGIHRGGAGGPAGIWSARS